MSAERKLHEDDAAYLGVVAVAQFIDIGWIRQWPMTVTRVGIKAVRNGYGLWKGGDQLLPYVTTPSASRRPTENAQQQPEGTQP